MFSSVGKLGNTCSFAIMLNWEINVSGVGHVGKLGNIVYVAKMFLNLFGSIFASHESKFCLRTPWCKLRNIMINSPETAHPLSPLQRLFRLIGNNI